jgi:hypothetical protein
MAKIFINYNYEDSKVCDYLSSMLSTYGHKVNSKDPILQMGRKWDEFTLEHLAKVDVIISIWSKFCEDSPNSKDELLYLRGYAYERGESVLFIIISLDNSFFPIDISEISYLSAKRDELDNTVKNIIHAIDNFLGRRDAYFRERKEEFEKIEKTAADYIEDTISELKTKEKTLFGKANSWYLSGYISLIIGILLTIIIAVLSLKWYNQFNNLYIPLFISIKTFIVIGLLILLSKYSFSLGKSLMNESLTNSNRIHAISFGRFYLRAYGQQCKKEEIKEVFQHWNIDQPANVSSDAEKYDPKLFESVIELLKAIRKIK